ncbi:MULTISPECIES: AAA family ATPase [Stenotrophomonas]|uniref:AAA family ATPase n=1 Tax=Stenotrophomonas TaxID=40323 RepID=UPI0027E3B985|nr:AAA family ATPase [Stenotrophomonas sp. Sm10]MDQ7313161.1 AAA family ATPase [Stenotrophomonas sp. Sm10]
MPEIQDFTIENFKGIDEVKIDLRRRSKSPVITLIGLNESGKTTILEALSHFVTGNRSIASLFDGQYSKSSGIGIIPIQHKAAFSGSVSIRAEIKLSATDVEEITKTAKKHRIKVDSAALRNEITVERRFTFVDSILTENANYWTIDLLTKKGSSSSFTEYKRPSKEGVFDLWLDTVNYIQDHLEQVSYFPTFLVEMPARIYLEEHSSETAINRHYRFAFQDVLGRIDPQLSIEKHIVQRIREFKDSQNSSSWLSKFLGSPRRTPIDSVFQKVSSSITREVLGSWHRVFQKSVSIKSITVGWGVDEDRDDMPYATFHVTDGESNYAINERSLGFRWFFSFLLFTGFNNGKERKTIFVFDEPAANLHAKAQAELLTSFARIASDGNFVIYSTHSHHMINPAWLSSSYIVENAALDYDRDDTFGLDTKPTQITACTYKKFVSKFPTRSSYFQPVIEKLEYVAPELIGAGPYLIVEGITDFYALTIAARSIKNKINYRIIPGTGSGSSGPIISQLLGQATTFSILLDDDKEGRKAAERYKNSWYLNDNQVITLEKIDKKFSGMAIEVLLGQETIDRIADRMKIEGAPSKKQIGWYLAESCASNEASTAAMPSSAVDRLNKILGYFESRFGSANKDS